MLYYSAVGNVEKHCWIPNCEGCQQMVRGYDYIAKSMQQVGIMLGKQVKKKGSTCIHLYILNRSCHRLLLQEIQFLKV
jgi:hypothetical protein